MEFFDKKNKRYVTIIRDLRVILLWNLKVTLTYGCLIASSAVTRSSGLSCNNFCMRSTASMIWNNIEILNFMFMFSRKFSKWIVFYLTTIIFFLFITFIGFIFTFWHDSKNIIWTGSTVHAWKRGTVVYFGFAEWSY